ncbi:MAG: YdeI/OmpD-associated family protein, partial [Brevibacterium aurantiacum]|nr:YdeI/OmpD-associated family protein [Brevibacterium aurantiacum]
DVSLTPTKEWPETSIPDDFGAALEDAPELTEVWASLTPMARWEWVRWIQATKNAETRARRVEVAISKLESGKRRPCCFDLASCTDPELAKSGKLLGIS